MTTVLNVRQLVQQSGLTLLQQLAAALCSLITTLLMARHYGPATHGLYTIAITTAGLVGLVVNLGTPAATAYVVSCRLVGPRQAGCYSGVIALGLGGLGAAAITGAVAHAPQTLWPGVPPPLLYWAAGLVPALLLSQLMSGTLQGAQAFTQYNSMALLAPLTLCVLSVAAMAAGAPVTVCLAAAYLGHLLAAAWGAWQIYRLPQQTDAVSPAPVSRRLPTQKLHRPTVKPNITLLQGVFSYFQSLMKFGLLAALANAMAYATYRIDVFFLNAWVPKEMVGHYNVAVSVAERLWMLSQAINVVLFAQVAQQHGAKSTPRATAGYAFGANPTPALIRHVLWAIAAVAVVVWATAPWIIPGVFGASYVGAVAPLRALLPGVVFFNVARILSQDLAGRGLVRLNVAVGAACLLLNIGLNMLWIRRYGAVGAAWASTISYSVDSLTKMKLYNTLTGTPWRHMLHLQREDWQHLRHWLG